MTTQNKNIAPSSPENPDEHAFGSYAYDRISGVAGSTDDIHDGNIAFHSPQTLHDERSGVYDEATGRTMTDVMDPWEAEGVDIQILDEAQLLEDALHHRRQGEEIEDDSLLDDEPEDEEAAMDALVDEWMEKEGHKW